MNPPTLVGHAQNYLAYFIAALLRIGKRGLGLKRSRCALVSLESVLLNTDSALLTCRAYEKQIGFIDLDKKADFCYNYIQLPKGSIHFPQNRRENR